jgi:hypothetical protein
MGCQTFTTMLDPSRPMADDRTPAERRAGLTPLTGTCMSGQVRFEVAAPLVGALYCHCTRCQRRSGTAFSMNRGHGSGLVPGRRRRRSDRFVAATRWLGEALLPRDRYRLMVFPVMLGAGKRLFNAGDLGLKAFRLADAATTDTGVAMLTYEAGQS